MEVAVLLAAVAAGGLNLKVRAKCGKRGESAKCYTSVVRCKPPVKPIGANFRTRLEIKGPKAQATASFGETCIFPTEPSEEQPLLRLRLVREHPRLRFCDRTLAKAEILVPLLPRSRVGIASVQTEELKLAMFPCGLTCGCSKVASNNALGEIDVRVELRLVEVSELHRTLHLIGAEQHASAAFVLPKDADLPVSLGIAENLDFDELHETVLQGEMIEPVWWQADTHVAQYA